jgi:hypothetical protein
MSYIEDIEQAIADRLAPFGAIGYTVQVLPENQEEYATKPFLNSQITVAFHSSKYAGHNSVGLGASQYEDVFFILAIRSKKLRGDKGIYNIVSIVRRYLVGFKPAGFWPLSAQEMGLKEATREDALWTYYMTFKTKALAVEEPIAEDEIWATLLKFDIDILNETIETPIA